MKSLKLAKMMNLTDNLLGVQVAAEVNAGPSTSRSVETPRTEGQLVSMNTDTSSKTVSRNWIYFSSWTVLLELCTN
jgi:hypothetical protein